MKILIEGTFFKFKFITGIERHFFLLLDLVCGIEMFTEIHVVLTHDIPTKTKRKWSNINYIFVSANTKNNWESIYKLYKIDIMYSSFEPPALFPPNPVKLIYVLHDAERYLYPEFIDTDAIGEHMDKFAKYLDNNRFYVVTVSQSSKREIVKIFPCLAQKIYVIYNFISQDLIQKRNKPYKYLEDFDEYFLVIGKYRPGKNVVNIVKAFEQRSIIFSDFKLVIVGMDGWYYEFTNYIQEFMPDNIVVYDHVSDDKLIQLIRNCYGFISASIHEGFGMPVIESYYLGAKRIFLSDINVYKELKIKDSIFFSTFDISDIRKKVFTQIYPESHFKKESFLFTYENVMPQFQNVVTKIFTG